MTYRSLPVCVIFALKWRKEGRGKGSRAQGILIPVCFRGEALEEGKYERTILHRSRRASHLKGKVIG